MGKIFTGKDIWGDKKSKGTWDRHYTAWGLVPDDIEGKEDVEEMPTQVIYLGWGYYLEVWDNRPDELFYDKTNGTGLSHFEEFDEEGHPIFLPGEP